MEAREARENTLTTAMFFVGFIVLFDGRCPDLRSTRAWALRGVLAWLLGSRYGPVPTAVGPPTFPAA